jgi:protein phosphatase
MATSGDESLSSARAAAVTAPRPPAPDPPAATTRDDDAPERPRRSPVRALAVLVVLVLLLGGALWVGWRYTQSQYYVGETEDGVVAVFRGVPGRVAGMELNSEQTRSQTKVSDLTDVAQQAVKQGIRADSEADAQRKMDELTRVNLKACPPSPEPSGTQSAGPSVDPSTTSVPAPSDPASGSPTDPSASVSTGVSPAPSQSANCRNP